MDRAIHHLKIAVNEEKDTTALFNLAVIYEEKGERQKAKECYRDVLKNDPNNFQSKNNLAVILEKEGRSSDA